jgi:hypothetical protein
MQRPTGITILAALYGLGGVVSVLFGLALGVFSASSGFEFSDELGIFAEFGPLLAAGLFFLGLLFVVAARGLWSGRPWARNFALALQVIGILIDLGFAPFTGGSTAFGIIIGLAVIYYLTRPNVKSFFAAARPSQTPTPLQTPTYNPPYQPAAAGGTYAGTAGVGGAQPRIFCSQCGTENPSATGFCKNCGARMLT